MKKIYMKMLSVIMAAVFVFGSAPLGGIDFSELAELFRIEASAEAAWMPSKAQLEGDFYYNDISGMEDYIEEGTIIESGVEILKYTGNDENVVIPSELGGKPVVVISQYAFCPDELTQKQKDKNAEYQTKYNRDYYLENINCLFIESVTIPASVFYISIDAFKNCVNLEKIEFAGEGIEWIDERAFENTALTEINIPRTLKGIGVNCFNKTEITDIVFGKNDADHFELWWNAFYGSKVRTVTFKSNGVQIYAGSFTGSYVNTITFEGSVELFEKGAMPINNNPIQEIIFKSDYPAELSRMLVLEYGYNCYYYSDYVSFSKRSPSHGELLVSADGFAYTVENNYATIVDYGGTSGEVDIPETLGGYVVNKIGSTAFRDFKYYDKIQGKTIYLSDVRIPSTVKEIGAFAFADNGFLSNVEFGSGLQKIGASAFAGCTVLYDVALPSATKEIGDYCFMDTNLKTFSAPGIKKIPVSAFENCARLSSVVLSGGMESIGAYAFKGCSSLRNIVIPEGTTLIEPYTFEGCTSLATVTLPESIREIGRYAFNNCTSLKTVTNTGFIETLGEYAFAKAPLSGFDFSSVKGEIPEYCFNNGSFEGKTVTVPSTVEKIGQYAFNACDFSKLVLNDGVKELGKYTFADNTMLTSANIPGSVTTVPMRCFSGCNISSLDISEGVKKICSYAFSSAELKELTVPESLEEIENKAFFNSEIETLNYNSVNCVFVNASGTVGESPFYENVCAVNIGDKVENIPDYFLTNTKITTVTVPASVKNIGKYAFALCKKLTEVNLPDTLQVLDNYSFMGCTGLTEFTIPKGLTSFKSYVLKNCTSLETINYNAVNCVVPSLSSGGELVHLSPFSSSMLSSLKYFNIGEGVANIPDSLCAGMSFLEQITLPSTVTDIGDGAFYKCSFETIELPSKLESVGEFAFACCSNLKSIELPESMRIINRCAFYRCTKLESVDMKNGVVYMGDDVFNGCMALKTVVLSENINTVPARTFESCDALEEIYIPDSVVRIGEEAFRSCNMLVKVRMSPNVTYIADGAFNYCEALSEFIWDSDSKLIGRLAFGNCSSLKDFNFIGIEKLYENSFHNSGISVVTLGEAKNEEAAKLEEIEAQSFMECENLEALGIGGNVAVIKTQAFANCTNLETAVIADSVTQIAPDAFDGCDNLTIYCSENSYAYTYATEQGIPVSTFVIAAIPNHTYTGSRIEPKVSVSLSGKSLSESSDFSVGYDNNINVGIADVNVKGKGVYKMFASKANFTIVTKSITLVASSPVAAQKYTGSEVKPDVMLTDGARVLRNGVDYSLTYKNNTAEGTATLIVTGIGNYSGSISQNFEIEKQSFFRSIMSKFAEFFNRMIASVRSFFSQFIITKAR